VSLPSEQNSGTFRRMSLETLSPTSTVLDALALMDKIGIGIVVIADDAGLVEGILSDGDIRRALLRGIGLGDSIKQSINRNFVRVGPETGRAEVLDLLKARHFNQIPIIDAAGRLMGVHTYEKILGIRVRPNWAVIMAGGEGTRLRPITETIPKPMIRVAGRPILERIVLHLVSHGIRKIFLSVNYLSEVIEDHFENGDRFGCLIEYLREDKPLGSGGALSLIPDPESPVLVMNGDLVTDVDIGELLDFHEANDCYATMGIKPYQHVIPFGCIKVDEKGMIHSIEEKPLLIKNVNSGVYAFSKEAVASVPKDSYFPITKIFETALEQNLKCGSVMLENEWIDIGQPSELRKARGLD